MANSFTLRILTPAGVVLETQVSEAYLPSSQGEIGILPGHTRYTGLLGTGVLTYVESGHTLSKRLVISEGFCNFLDDHLIVLTDTADISDNVDAEQLAKNKSAALKAISELNPVDPNWKASRARLDRYEAIERILPERR